MKIVDDLLSAKFPDTFALLRSRRARNPLVAEELLKLADRANLSSPGRSLRVATLGVRMAHQLPEYFPRVACLRTRSFAALGDSHRAAGRHCLAWKAFHIAEQHQCQRCEADLCRRKGYLQYVSGNISESLRELDRALDIYREIEDDNGVAKALLRRAQVRYLSGDYPLEALIAETEEALFLFDEDETVFRMASYHTLSYLLSRSSKLVDFGRAVALIPKIQEHLKGVDGLSVERAKLKWLQGNLCAKVGWFGIAERYLETARNQLVKLKLKHDIAAVTADLATAKVSDRAGIKAACRAVLALVLPEHAAILEKIISDEGNLVKHIEALRAAATYGYQPQPI